MQGSVIEGIENLRPMPPDNRVSVKMTYCISNYCNLNNRTLDMVNDISFIRIMAAATNPRYQFYSSTYMTKTKLPLRYAAAVRSIHNILDAQPGGGSNQMFGSLKMLLATVWMNNLSLGYLQ